MPPHHRPHHSHGRRFGRGGRTFIVGTPYEETVFLDCVRDIDGICIPEDATGCCGAGDLLPTFVSASDAQRYIDEVNTSYTTMNQAVSLSQVASDFKASWDLQWQGWIHFATDARASVTFWNAKAVMQQTDRWADQLKNWYASFQKAGGQPPPAPTTPGQGIPDPNATSVGNLTTLALVVGGVAALVIFGPKLARVL